MWVTLSGTAEEVKRDWGWGRILITVMSSVCYCLRLGHFILSCCFHQKNTPSGSFMTLLQTAAAPLLYQSVWVWTVLPHDYDLSQIMSWWLHTVWTVLFQHTSDPLMKHCSLRVSHHNQPLYMIHSLLPWVSLFRNLMASFTLTESCVFYKKSFCKEKGNSPGGNPD